MENGVMNGRNGDGHSNHERHPVGQTNGDTLNGREGTVAMAVAKDTAPQQQQQQQQLMHTQLPLRPPRMNDLPDTIQHVTDNFVPLGFLLERLAQKTHNNLEDVIRELVRKPVAPRGAAANGDGGGGMAMAMSMMEDGSVENVEKKKMLLEFARGEHANWVKALVITEWSKKATQISKLIDLENHMFEEELVKYEQAVFTMLNLKRNLHAARVPSPDLRTALQVLAQGNAPWMPDLGFIEPPPLTPEEQLRWLDDISTLLALRLNLQDHDSIPPAFRDNYTIASGRVTFCVANEFEVDLTLASDDFSEQLWFLDLRFLFTPAPADLTDSLRQALEDQVNGVLATEGLPGCYRCLHEYVLTHKVNELRRQALELARGRWIETLRVEKLNRAIAIQYWTGRNGGNSSSSGSPAGPKSWFIIGVHSGREKEDVEVGGGDKAVGGPGKSTPGAARSSSTGRRKGRRRRRVFPPEQQTSRLGLRWFRDGKEVRDGSEGAGEDDGIIEELEEMYLSNNAQVSVEKLLLAIVGRHVEHLLSGMHARLLGRPLFAEGKASLWLRIDERDPGLSVLEMQLVHRDRLAVHMDPVTGNFAMAPPSRIVLHGESRMNAGGAASGGGGGAAAAAAAADPIDDAVAVLEGVRCMSVQDDLGRRAKSHGWTVVRGAVVARPEELRQLINLRDSYQVLWLKRADWDAQWHVLACLSLRGDRWWLVELDHADSGARIRTHMELPLGIAATDLDGSFFSNLTVFAAGVAAQYTDIEELARRGKQVSAVNHGLLGLPEHTRLPAIRAQLSDLLASSSATGGPGGGGRHAFLSNHVTETTGEARSAAGGRHKAISWAKDSLRLTFRGIDLGDPESQPEEKEQGQPGQPGQRRIGVLAEARLEVTERTKFELLGGGPDKGNSCSNDVSYNAQTGEFCLYLRTRVGVSVVDALVSRLQAIERVVGLLDAIRRESHRGVRCELVTLRKLVFSYGDVDESGQGQQGQQGQQRWTATVDLTRASSPSLPPLSFIARKVQLQLPRGCPHLRVVDFFNSVASDATTMEAVPYFLVMTLGLHRALDRVEDSWELVQQRNLGMLGIFPRALDWIVLRFLFASPPPQTRLRQLVLEIRLRSRHGVNLWQVRRLDADAGNAAAASAGGSANSNGAPDGDDISRALRAIFSRRGPGWKGLQTAAVASPLPGEGGEVEEGEAVDEVKQEGKDSKDKNRKGLWGIEACLADIDESVRALLPTALVLPGGMSVAQLQQRRAQAAAQAQAQAQAQAAAQAQQQVQQMQQMQQMQMQQAQTARMG